MSPLPPELRWIANAIARLRTYVPVHEVLVFASTKMKAIWNGQVIAESDDTVVVENNHYFPQDAVRAEFLVSSNTHTTCPWKGVASYYTLHVDGQNNVDAAWYYPDPKSAASQIKGRVAFWKGVQVTN